MNRREFTAAMLAAGAAIPLGITRAAGQTKGGTLNTIIQPEPPILVTAFSLFTDALRDALDPKLKGMAGA